MHQLNNHLFNKISVIALCSPFLIGKFGWVMKVLTNDILFSVPKVINETNRTGFALSFAYQCHQLRSL